MKDIKTAVFAGGCFWCTEAVFKELTGVKSVVPGYTGGTVKNPTYAEVCTGSTKHAQAVKVEYDSDRVSFEQLLLVFFGTHDPTTVNRQMYDVGTQYRSAIFYADLEQKHKAERVIRKLTEEKVFRNPIVTTLELRTEFFVAEDYHRNYFERNPTEGYCQIIIEPKMRKFREDFDAWVTGSEPNASGAGSL